MEAIESKNNCPGLAQRIFLHKMIKFVYLIVVINFLAIGLVNGHARLLDPVSRGSLWRYDNRAPANYNDNQLFCGGFWVCIFLTQRNEQNFPILHATTSPKEKIIIDGRIFCLPVKNKN